MTSRHAIAIHTPIAAAHRRIIQLRKNSFRHTTDHKHSPGEFPLLLMLLLWVSCRTFPAGHYLNYSLSLALRRRCRMITSVGFSAQPAMIGGRRWRWCWLFGIFVFVAGLLHCGHLFVVRSGPVRSSRNHYGTIRTPVTTPGRSLDPCERGRGKTNKS